MSLNDDLAAEGAPEKEGTPGIAASFPRKRVAAAALFRDASHRILLVEPTYRENWLLPGGVVEENEDPHAGCSREVLEELGVALPIGGLLVVDFVPRHGIWGDSMQFTFDGGVLHDPPTFTLQTAELRSAGWFGPDDWDGRLAPSQIRRCHAALRAARTGVPEYLRFGRPLQTPPTPS